jgi:hypothetical protein
MKSSLRLTLSRSGLRAFALAVWAATAVPVFANHGPGTSGGGSATASGETLKRGKFELAFREDYTQFEDVSRAQAERRALKAGEFDALERSFLTTAALSYGVTDDFQVGGQIGYYAGSNFIDAESEDGVTAESASADPSGLTDLALTAKYRLIKGQPGNVAVIGGVIAPTGRDDVRLSNGEALEPSSQPGTGAWAYQVGAAYSRFLTPRVTTDLSAIYTIRTPHDGFEVGDRLDLGVAFAYRLTKSIKTFPNYGVFAEATAVWLGKDEDGGEENPNSGGWTVYLTPGARVRLNESVALTVAPSVPVLQDLNGEQIESRFKLAVALSFSL